MFFSFRAILSVLLIFAFAGCSSTKKKATMEDSMAMEDTTSSSIKLNGDSDSGMAGALKTVHFSFNSAALSTEVKDDLASNSAFLQDNPNVQVQIEGHCDERGGVQYNLALGEKRAMATKDYLVSLGIDSSRITVISFGKERPIAFGHDEMAWKKNRRSNFVITAK